MPSTRRPTRLHPQLLAGAESAPARDAQDWLRRHMVPFRYEGVARVERTTDVFVLAGDKGNGLLVESGDQLAELPGVYRTRTSVWVRLEGDDGAWLLEALTHSWDAWTYASATGDNQWVEVPRRRMYVERDRRTAEVAAAHDRWSVERLRDGVTPALAGLDADKVRSLAETHAPALLAGGANDGPASASSRPLTWEAFEQRLAKALAAMQDETFLVLNAPARDGHPAYYVQFASGEDYLRAEAVGSGYLPPSQPLSEQQRRRIRELGWTEPDGDDERNAHRMWDAPAPVRDVAALAVATLRTVFGVEEPARLRSQYAAFPGFTGTLRRLPSLGVRREAPRRPDERSRGAKGIRQLRSRVEKALAAWLGVPKVFPDEDGDYPIRTGSAICYLRILDGVPPAVSVFSPVLRDVTVTGDLLVAIDDINGRTRYGRVFTSGPAVLVAMELPAIDLTPAHVAFACQELGALADHLDDVLHGRFGGHVAFDTSRKLLN